MTLDERDETRRDERCHTQVKRCIMLVPVDLTAAQTGRARVTRRLGHSIAWNAAWGPETAARERRTRTLMVNVDGPPDDEHDDDDEE